MMERRDVGLKALLIRFELIVGADSFRDEPRLAVTRGAEIREIVIMKASMRRMTSRQPQSARAQSDNRIKIDKAEQAIPRNKSFHQQTYCRS